MRYIFCLIGALLLHMTVLRADESNYRVENDTAQYKGSDYANVVQVERGISLERAYEIADANPDIDYFVYLKGWQMVLEIPSDTSFDPSQDPFNLVSHIQFRYDSGMPGEGYCRIFKHGDVVFFKQDGMWLGSAPGLADTYFKIKNA